MYGDIYTTKLHSISCSMNQKYQVCSTATPKLKHTNAFKAEVLISGWHRHHQWQHAEVCLVGCYWPICLSFPLLPAWCKDLAKQLHELASPATGNLSNRLKCIPELYLSILPYTPSRSSTNTSQIILAEIGSNLSLVTFECIYIYISLIRVQVPKYRV